MGDREELIRQLSDGNIFHAAYPNGASCICLVLTVSDDEIKSRRVTTQEVLIFDRRTGIEKDIHARALAVIDSIAPLPAEIFNVFLSMDGKYMAFKNLDEKARSRLELDPERRKLTDAEKKALLFIDTYYTENPLPPPGL